MGRLSQGRSTFRTLSEAELASFGGSARRRLFGCAVRVETDPDGCILDEHLLANSGCISEHELYMVTWSSVSKGGRSSQIQG